MNSFELEMRKPCEAMKERIQISLSKIEPKKLRNIYAFMEGMGALSCEDDMMESIGDVKKIIEETRKSVPEEFDLPGLDLVNAKEISRNVLDGVANGFYIGFYQGMRYATSRYEDVLEPYGRASDEHKELIERFAQKLAE